MHTRLILIPLLILGALVATAQAPALYFERITVQNGLSHNKVNCILQDQRGFMWIGTNDGLNRFDGHRFVIFRNNPEDKSTISGNLITGLLEDSEGILWITTADGGLSKYDFRLAPDKQFKQFRNRPRDSTSIPTNSLNALIEDKQKRLWLATSNASTILFDKKTEKFINPKAPGTKGIQALAMDSSGMIWIGRQGGGILKANPKTLQFETDQRYAQLYAELPHNEVSSLFKDRNNHIWFGSWDKQLYRFNSVSGTEETFLSKEQHAFSVDEVLSFAEDNKGNIWLGGHFSGLQLYNPVNNQFYQYTADAAREGTIADNRINCIYQDKNGMMWLGTGKGISVSNPVQQQFTQHFFPAVSKIPVTFFDLHEDEHKDLWFGTSEGLFIQHHGSGELVHRALQYKGEPLWATAFLEDGDDFYIGTNYSVFLYDKKTGALKILPGTEKDKVMNKIIESRVVSFIKDSIEGRPVLLASPYGHFITYYDLVEKRWVSRLDSTKNIIANFKLKDNFIHKFFKTKNNKIWLANAMQGLGEWNKTPVPTVTYHTNNPSLKNGLSNNHVYDIVEDNRGNLWISTYGGGLHFRNAVNGEITHIPNSPNLLEGLQLDNHGNVWMISNGDIAKYNPAKKTFTIFNLPDIEKSGGVSGYFFKDTKGKMYVKGANYFIPFHPDSVGIQRLPAKIWFTDFQVFGASNSDLLQREKIVLPYYRNTISIAFAAPDYTFSYPLNFAYKLEGTNSDWSESDPSHIANYANLPGGDYVFMVKISNMGNGQTEIAKLPIRIIPPYWQRWWFYLVCAAVISLLIWLIYRYRINELVKRQAIRNKIAQDLHDSMGSALSSISIYSRVAQIKNTRNEKNELQHVLEKITTTSTDVISEMNDIVWTINPQNDSMEKIIARMESYAKPLAAANSINFQFAIDKNIHQVNLTMEKRKNFYLIFKEAFNNAIKYAGATEIIATISVQKGNVILQIKDNGKGFDMSQPVKHADGHIGGNGLGNMKMRAEEMAGSCKIVSTAGAGTSIMLEFPL